MARNNGTTPAAAPAVVEQTHVTPDILAGALNLIYAAIRESEARVMAHVQNCATVQRDAWHDERVKLGGMLDRLAVLVPAEARAAAQSVTPPAATPIAPAPPLELASQAHVDAPQAAVTAVPAMQERATRYAAARPDLALARNDALMLRAWLQRVEGSKSLWAALDGRQKEDGASRFNALRARCATRGVAKLAQDVLTLTWLCMPATVAGLVMPRACAILNRWRTDSELLAEYDAARAAGGAK